MKGPGTVISDECRAFYERRDQRSVEYLGRDLRDLPRAHVAIDGTSIRSAAGQLALLALANQLARVCRHISFELPADDVKVLVRTPFAAGTLVETLLSTVHEIDPCGDFAIGSRPLGPCVAIAIGAEVAGRFDWYIGADRALAFLRRAPVGFTEHPSTLRGAALASCLGCAAVFRQQLGLGAAERQLSAWNYAEGDSAEPGPDSLDPLNVGSVLMVGAGAVGAALAFWLYAFGATGEGWAVVDRDNVELHNTNRGLPFTPRHAGWPAMTAAKKVDVVAPLLPGATKHDCWYHECSELVGRRFDVVLALANDHDARERLTQCNAAVSFQATTGDNWLSQLHRHILGRDGCIFCRTGEIKTAVMSCSTGAVEGPGGSRSDAALPFLSAASGLMLATALQRLAAGDLEQGDANCWSWDFGSEFRMTPIPTARVCRPGCALVATPNVRRKLVASSRWAHLVDPTRTLA